MPSRKGYEPIEDERSKPESTCMRRRNVKIGGLCTLIAVVLGGVVLVNSNAHFNEKVVPQAEDMDALFSAMLLDDKGFYFPTTSQEHTDSTRALKKKTEGSRSHSRDIWSYNWKLDKRASSAIGEYYRSKGMALGDYYRSRYHPAYGTGADASDAAPPSQDQWSIDWKVDKYRGIALGENYAKIGKATDDHYRQVFDPTYLRASTGIPSYDWQADSKRGIAIGKYYKNLGVTIAGHYSQLYAENDSAHDTQVVWGSLWKEYKARGEEMAKYYHDKGMSTGRFYEGCDPSTTARSEQQTGDTGGKSSDFEKCVLWGVDWRNKASNKEHAIDLHAEFMEKGVAIREYYRAKYGPTYSPDADTKDDWPPWGVNPEADKEHGKAIGEYYKKQGQEIEKYEERGKAIGRYYEDYYRSLFDPTYNATVDLNW